MVTPIKGYFRLYPGIAYRLRYGYVVECTGFDQDASGRVTAVHCRYFPDSHSGSAGADQYKVKGNVHWVAVEAALQSEVRLVRSLCSRCRTLAPAIATSCWISTRIPSASFRRRWSRRCNRHGPASISSLSGTAISSPTRWTPERVRLCSIAQDAARLLGEDRAQWLTGLVANGARRCRLRRTASRTGPSPSARSAAPQPRDARESGLDRRHGRRIDQVCDDHPPRLFPERMAEPLENPNGQRGVKGVIHVDQQVSVRELELCSVRVKDLDLARVPGR